MDDWRRGLGEALGSGWPQTADGRQACAAPKLDEPLSRHTTIGIGGPADAWVTADTAGQLGTVLGFCLRSGVECRVLGRGSNVLVSDQGLRGVTVRLGGELASPAVSCEPSAVGPDGEVVLLTAGAGAAMDQVVDWCEAQGLAGVEFMAGIPGTLGGGLCSNAGASGRSLGDVVESVSGLGPDGAAWQAQGTDLCREYRRSMVPPGVTATQVRLRLERRAPLPAARIRAERRSKHPTEPSAGSFFRNPELGGERVPAGRLIDECGLRGRAVGGARVSDKHANFIVNAGGARFADVLELGQLVKAAVEQRFGVVLDEEVQFLPGVRR
jgi:UDP-N-acetylmuramate dehydrogenase